MEAKCGKEKHMLVLMTIPIYISFLYMLGQVKICKKIYSNNFENYTKTVKSLQSHNHSDPNIYVENLVELNLIEETTNTNCSLLNNIAN